MPLEYDRLVRKYAAHLASVSCTDTQVRKVSDSLFGPNHPLRMEIDEACARLGPEQATLTDLLGVSFASHKPTALMGTCVIDKDSPTPPLPGAGAVAVAPEVRVSIEPPGFEFMPMTATLNREALIVGVPLLLSPMALSLFWRWRDMLVASPHSLTHSDPVRAVHGFFTERVVDTVLNMRSALIAGRITRKNIPLDRKHYLMFALNVVIRFGVPVVAHVRKLYKRRLADSWFVCASLHSGIHDPLYLDSIALRDLTVPGIALDTGPVPPCGACDDGPEAALSRYADPARHALSVAVLTPVIGAESAELLVSMHDTLCAIKQEDGDGSR
jgi:hypothetical protein